MCILGLVPGGSADQIGCGVAALLYSADSPRTIWPTEGACLAVCNGSAFGRFDHYSLLLDGRIDNCAELSEKLDIQTESPADLLLYAYRRWRDDFPNHLLGDYAFALWDGLERRLLLGRDPAGCRPLHYGFRGSEFLFGSEARALLAMPGMRMVPDEEKVAAWLAFVANRNSMTFFQGISTVQQGCTVLFERGRVTARPFWDPRKIPPLHLADHREYAEGLRCVLQQAVLDRLAPGKKIGSHLSGGLDSSSVTTVAAALLEERGERLTAFTAIPAMEVDDAFFLGRFGDEQSHASAVVGLHRNIDHVLISNHAERMFPAMDRMNTTTERPALNPMNAIWLDAINLQAKQRGLEVVLNGILGNSTISYAGVRALPMMLRGGRLDEAARLAHDYHKHGQSWLFTANLAFRPLLPSVFGRLGDLLRGKPFNLAADATGARREFLRAHGHRPLDFPVIAHKVDGKELRICMMEGPDMGMYGAAAKRLYGIEEGNPTADRRVVEFCLSIPEEQFCRGGIPRSLIREAMAGRVPDAVLKERRKGLQASDFFPLLTTERHEIIKELEGMQQSELLSRALDLPALNELAARWPAQPANSREWFNYCVRLTRAISIGRFVRRMEERTIFSRQEANPEPYTAANFQ
jgi:asparagine synthase (glutamine-hydrolysing)